MKLVCMDKVGTILATISGDTAKAKIGILHMNKSDYTPEVVGNSVFFHVTNPGGVNITIGNDVRILLPNQGVIAIDTHIK
jgi:hypothetical protein